MSVLYIESSAVLSWLLGEEGSVKVIDILNDFDTILTSVLTIVETERALIRAERQNLIKAADRSKLSGILASRSSSWNLLEINSAVRARASLPFPVEPIRSLDAIHLATALEFLRIFPDLTVLSLDQRVRDNLEPLGLSIAG
jgi:hypothetical protein